MQAAGNANSYSHIYSYTYGDGHLHSYPNAYGNGKRNTHSNTYTYHNAYIDAGQSQHKC